MKSIVQICQYLFEYNDDLIEYYKNHMNIGTANRHKEKMEQEIMNNFDL